MKTIVFDEPVLYKNINDRSLFDLSVYYGKRVTIFVDDDKPSRGMFRCGGCGEIVTPDEFDRCPNCNWEMFGEK